MPQGVSEALPVASRYELTEGDAEIICTLGDDGPKHYTVSISKIDRNGTDNKNFVITVTDQALKERTGGIVQGMSGSPILQNGKLVGAVTHVLINDPAKGYGIFIENMLDAAG
jgi:stage IV sporulation protein B